MYSKERVFIVITAYNVSDSIAAVVEELMQDGFKNIIIVDDCSTDNTLEVSKTIKDVKILHHIVNRGQGAALETGQKFALSQGAEYIVHYDGDGQHSPDKILQAVEILSSSDYEIAIGTRFGKGAERINMPFKKIVILKMGIIFTWFVSGIWLSDTHNGFRVIKASTIPKLAIKMDRFEHASEIIDYIKWKKIKYVEIPVKISYSEYSNMRGQKIWNSVNILLNVLVKKINDILTA
jgi:glycosyltransferase involved in cell wall biosynthesis